MNLLLNNSSLRERLIEQSKEQIKKFDWDLTATDIVKLINEI